MKKTLLLLMIALPLMFSCSKDEETTTPTIVTDKIVGTWKRTAITIQNGANGVPTSTMETCSTSETYTYTQTSSNQTNGVTSGTMTAILYDYVSPNCVGTTNNNNTWVTTGTFYNMNYNNSGIVQTTATFSNNNNTLLLSTNDGPYIIKETFARQ